MYTRRQDMEGTNIDRVTILAGTTGTWTPVCLARADLIGVGSIGIPNLTKQNAKWYSPSQV